MHSPLLCVIIPEPGPLTGWLAQNDKIYTHKAISLLYYVSFTWAKVCFKI